MINLRGGLSLSISWWTIGFRSVRGESEDEGWACWKFNLHKCVCGGMFLIITLVYHSNQDHKAHLLEVGKKRL